MDNLIELMAYFLTDWQQTAIDNTRYSVVLIALSILFGGLMVLLWERKRIATMKEHVLLGEQHIEQAEKNNEELLSSLKTNSGQIVELEQQIEQIKTNRLQEGEAYQAKIVVAEKQYHSEIQNKQVEIDRLQSVVGDKTQLAEHLQSEISQLVLDQQKRLEIENEHKQFSNEFNSVKQQLDQRNAELAEKAIQIEKFEQTALFDKETVEKESRIHQTDFSEKLENTIQKQNQQLAQFNDKLRLFLMDSEVGSEAEADVGENKDKEGFINKLLNMISALDNVDFSENKTQNEGSLFDSTHDEDVWQKHQKIIDQLIDNLPIDLATDVAESSNQLPNEKSREFQDIQEDELSPEFSEQTNDLIEKMDLIQDRVKGYYHKISQMVPKKSG